MEDDNKLVDERREKLKALRASGPLSPMIFEEKICPSTSFAASGKRANRISKKKNRRRP